MRLIFAGSPQFAVPPLRRLLSMRCAHGIKVAAVLTSPDRPAGRSATPGPSTVKEAAVAAGTDVLQPEIVGRAFATGVARLKPDLLVAVAYGKIFRPYFLDVFPLGGINLHPSLLPELRGPSPIPAAILAGAETTGVTVQCLANEVDAGDVLLQRKVRLDGSETTASLGARLAELGSEVLADAVLQIVAGTTTPAAQNEDEATYCGLIVKEDGRIDWSRRAEEIERAVRAYHPWPRAFTSVVGQQLLVDEAEIDAGDDADRSERAASGTVLRVDKRRGILVNTGAGTLLIKRLQLQGKRPMAAAAFANGFPDLRGTVLGSDAT